MLSALDGAGIWYMPLKGTLLKDLYPKTGMREMADNDILFDASRCGDVKRIMESLGFEIKAYGTGPHDSYLKPPVSNFEMHRKLFDDSFDKCIAEYCKDVNCPLRDVKRGCREGKSPIRKLLTARKCGE